MASLGKCLLFYLKYHVEMERLYETEEPKVEGLPDPDRNLQRISLVGDAASREGVELLKACVPVIDAHFRTISAVQPIRGNLEKRWDLRFRVAPRETTDRYFEIGVAIELSRTALIPWVWCRGGRRAEDEIVRILRLEIKKDTLKYQSGTVRLAEIKIPVPERLEEPAASDSLLAQVQQAFAPFTAQEVKAIAAIASNRGEA